MATLLAYLTKNRQSVL